MLDDVSPDGKPVFSAQAADEDRIHLESRIHLAKNKYEFGLYLGKDNVRHMGFDVAFRNDAGVAVKDDASGQHVVTKIDPGRGGVYAGFFTWYFGEGPKVAWDDVGNTE
jgi:hypothetical protein